ncbi:MAG TPA: methyltransferase domain-containing protein [Cerasibacillus sp.]|uniref:class I SAM-dependent methyltransferase n=1 Tax=Cerasibacillus sp. TaxID=2498711 RepID=UPI002F3F6731
MEEKYLVRKVFAENKEKYLTSSTHNNPNDLSLLVEWLQPTSNMTVLDIATGGGHVAKALSKHVKKVIASDITKEMLENTAKHLSNIDNIDYCIADAEHLPFLDSTFDIITCRIASHHFPKPDRFIREVKRVLKPQGQFMLIDNVAPEDGLLDQFINSLEKLRDVSHVRALKISEWKKLFNENQLTLIKERKNKKKLPYDEWTKRTLKSENEINKVTDFICRASENIKSYYRVKWANGSVQSFSIDEWTALYKN